MTRRRNRNIRRSIRSLLNLHPTASDEEIARTVECDVEDVRRARGDVGTMFSLGPQSDHEAVVLARHIEAETARIRSTWSEQEYIQRSTGLTAPEVESARAVYPPRVRDVELADPRVLPE